MDESNEASRRERTASTEAATAEVAKPTTKRPTWWWRSRTRAQLQVEFVCLRVADRVIYALAGECLLCNGSATQHGAECPLGDARTCEEIAHEIEGIL